MFPRILHIYGPLWVNGYGLMIALGFLAFTILSYCDPWRKNSIRAEKFLNVLFVGFLSAVIGGRVLFVLYELPTTMTQFFEIFYPWAGGFSLFGSIIAVIIGLSWYLRKNRTPILPFFDLLGFYAPVLLAISRIGCFFAGCCHGVSTGSVNWYSVVFTDPHGLAPLYTPLYPTQLYAVFANILFFFILVAVRKWVPYKSGTIIFSYLILASTARFTIDFWRGDREPGFVTSMQWLVFGVFVFACIALFLVRRLNMPAGRSRNVGF